MFIHNVFFSLREDLTSDEQQLFSDAVRGLTRIESVRSGYAGPPIPSDRPVVDGDYSIGLLVIFDDRAGHDAYQIDPLHKAFLALYSSYWTRVRIFDFAG